MSKCNDCTCQPPPPTTFPRLLSYSSKLSEYTQRSAWKLNKNLRIIQAKIESQTHMRTHGYILLAMYAVAVPSTVDDVFFSSFDHHERMKYHKSVSVFLFFLSFLSLTLSLCPTFLISGVQFKAMLLALSTYKKWEFRGVYCPCLHCMLFGYQIFVHSFLCAFRCAALNSIMIHFSFHFHVIALRYEKWTF